MKKAFFLRNILGLRSGRVTLTTVCSYLKHLGYRFDAKKKTFYVDGHERKDVVQDRNDCCIGYVRLELRCYRWVQLAESKVDELVEEKRICKSEGYRYESDGAIMYEYHVDCGDKLDEFVTSDNKKFGGDLSVRKPPGTKALRMVGQDEAIFNQWALGRRQWVLPNGKREILPKTDGESIMISGFTCRDHGFGWPSWLSDDELKDLLTRVNASRAGTKYKDEDRPETSKHFASSDKEDITLDENPFCILFEVGVSHDGYWTHAHMRRQIEDVADVLKELYPNDDILFWFDHSSSHNKLLEDGLNASRVGVNPGGNQPKMREAVIVDGCLGSFSPKLAIGDTQSMVFDESDEGPWWWSADKRQKEKFDRFDGDKTIDRPIRRDEIVRALNQKNVEIPKRKFNIKEFREFAEGKDVSTVVTERKVLPGWVGKPKGMKQILWERGLLDPAKHKQYAKIVKNKNGTVNEELSYRHILSSCQDFQTEKTDLQLLAEEIGVELRSSPKYHAELAGEGIEYVWALCKNWFKRLPLSARKTRESFRKKVLEAVSTRGGSPVVSLSRARSCAKRARSYIITYLYLHEKGLDAQDAESLTGPEGYSYMDIERISKLMRGKCAHRSAADTDTGFVNGLVVSRNNES